MKKILINDNPWQTRIAIIRDDELQNIYFSSHAVQTLERCFFKGIVVKVLPGIQTAFVDIGQERAGFLHISEIDRELAIHRMTGGDDDIDEVETPLKKEPSRRQLDISKILSEGEEILVQVSKEPVNEKGAKLSTCFTLPGRFIVLMPNIPRIGISKKIEDREERQRLRELLTANLPEGMGAIIRTTSENRSPTDIIQDLTYLVDTWKSIQKAFSEASAKQKIYEDIDASLQSVRDHLDEDVELVLCDRPETQNRIYKFVKNIAPEYARRVRTYEGDGSLFERFGIEKQINQALEKKVYLKSGGSIVIESTEAMTVVDVNTGRYIGSTNLEETIFKTNLEASDEIVRQLRLRNIGGLIVIDYIDMASGSNRQKLFKYLEKILKERDKFQSVVLRVSEFGLVQMTRKRSGKTLIQQMMEACTTCYGRGQVKSAQTESFALLRDLKHRLAHNELRGVITLSVHEEIFAYLTTHEYETLLSLERQYGRKIIIEHNSECALSASRIVGS
jgi:ribonuclease G